MTLNELKSFLITEIDKNPQLLIPTVVDNNKLYCTTPIILEDFLKFISDINWAEEFLEKLLELNCLTEYMLNSYNFYFHAKSLNRNFIIDINIWFEKYKNNQCSLWHLLINSFAACYAIYPLLLTQSQIKKYWSDLNHYFFDNLSNINKT